MKLRNYYRPTFVACSILIVAIGLLGTLNKCGSGTGVDKPDRSPEGIEVRFIEAEKTFESGISIVIIDSCEYILLTDDNNYGSIIHKENCKNHE